jgi:hypothetical protein
MIRMSRALRRNLSITVFAAVIVGAPHIAVAQSGEVQLVPHLAVYDLKLLQSRGKRPIESVRGRILYDFSGSSCEGYTLQFRQVSQIDTGEGKILMSDLRAATWEEGAAKSFRFKSQNFVDEKLADSVDGKAERRSAEISVSLTKPADKTISLETGIIFPTEHMRRIIEAARAGKSVLELAVYDGSETGEKVYDTLTVIGRPIAPDAGKSADAADAALAALQRWPVTISYFERAKKGGEQIPIYSIGFELYDNGISRALSLDYGDFVIAGEMTQLDVKQAAPCK